MTTETDGPATLTTVWRASLLISVLLLLWAVLGLPMPDRNSAPAWVQAIGSVGAIIVAIWINRQEHKRTRDQAKEAERLRVAEVRRQRDIATIVCAYSLSSLGSEADDAAHMWSNFTRAGTGQVTEKIVRNALRSLSFFGGKVTARRFADEVRFFDARHAQAFANVEQRVASYLEAVQAFQKAESVLPSMKPAYYDEAIDNRVKHLDTVIADARRAYELLAEGFPLPEWDKAIVRSRKPRADAGGRT